MMTSYEIWKKFRTTKLFIMNFGRFRIKENILWAISSNQPFFFPLPLLLLLSLPVTLSSLPRQLHVTTSSGDFRSSKLLELWSPLSQKSHGTLGLLKRRRTKEKPKREVPTVPIWFFDSIQLQFYHCHHNYSFLLISSWNYFYH